MATQDADFLNIITVCINKKGSERTRFTRAKEVTAKVMRELTKVMENCFHERFQKLYEHWQKYVIA
jgi:hypothetical protein